VYCTCTAAKNVVVGVPVKNTQYNIQYTITFYHNKKKDKHFKLFYRYQNCIHNIIYNYAILPDRKYVVGSTRTKNCHFFLLFGVFPQKKNNNEPNNSVSDTSCFSFDVQCIAKESFSFQLYIYTRLG
jgi:hypothetical protein